MLDLDKLPPPRRSWLDELAALPIEDQAAVLAGLTDPAAAALLLDWRFVGRREQQFPPGDWFLWMILAGRGFGKTRTGAEWLTDMHKVGGWRMSFIAARTTADLRKYCLGVADDGDDVTTDNRASGILQVSQRHGFPALYEPSKVHLVWPDGGMTHLFTGEKPDSFRGPNMEGGWLDEFAAWQYTQECWDMIGMMTRVGDVKLCMTTTPKPIKLIRELVKEAQDDPDSGIVVTTGSSYDNKANLSPKWFKRVVLRTEGTRLGAQEIHAQLLDEAEGALWKREWHERNRVAPKHVPELKRVAVAIDPAAKNTESASETGIVAGGVAGAHGYVLRDLSGHYSPDGWARKAILCYFELEADCIIAEENNGGDMVRSTITLTADIMKRDRLIPTKDIPVRLVRASRGKDARAEPVAALDEQGRIHHVGYFAELEDQCCTWEPNSNMRSPDRLDAKVWLFTKLMLSREDDVDHGKIQLFTLPNAGSLVGFR